MIPPSNTRQSRACGRCRQRRPPACATPVASLRAVAPRPRATARPAVLGKRALAMFLIVPLLGACDPCSSARQREVRFSADVLPVTGPPGEPLPVFAIMAGSTGRLSATAFEFAVGDRGCTGRGILGPDSSQEPAAFSWRSSDPEVVEVDDSGRLRGVRVGEARVMAASDGFDVVGSVTVRVVPAFVAIGLEPDSAAIAVGDTVGFLVTARGADGCHVSGVNFRTAGLVVSPAVPDADLPAGNTIWSELDADPPRFVYLGLARGELPLLATARVLGAEDLAAEGHISVR